MNYSVLGILGEPDVIQWATLRFGRPSSSSSGNSSFDMDLQVERQWKGTIGAPCTYAVISEVMGNLCSYRKSSYKSTYKSIVSS